MNLSLYFNINYNYYLKNKMEKAKQPPPTIKEENALQINIMEKAGIPNQEIVDYALSSVADGKVLRDYVNEVKKGETSIEDVIKKVKHDFEKMKDGEKDGKFVTPAASEQDESPK
jgi:hypothetical protein